MAKSRIAKLHKYRKVEFAGMKLFACALPDCSHYMPKHMEKMLEGKNSICWQCNKPFIMTLGHLEQDNPVCFNCSVGLPTDEKELTEIIAMISQNKLNQNQSK